MIISSDPQWKEDNARSKTVSLHPLTVHRVERIFCLNLSKPALISLNRETVCVHSELELKQLIFYLLILDQLKVLRVHCESLISQWFKGYHCKSFIRQRFKRAPL